MDEMLRSRFTSRPRELTADPITRRQHQRWRRIGIGTAILASGLVLVAVGTRWAYFRYGHIVTHNASVNVDATKVGARIDGQVSHLEVAVGQRVAKGEVLGRLEDLHLVARATQAQAELQRAVDELDVEQISIEQERRRLGVEIVRAKDGLGVAAAEVEAAESMSLQGKSEHARVAQLVSAGIGTVSRLDETTAQRDVALASAVAARARQQAAKGGYRAAVVELDGLVVRTSRLRLLRSQVEAARSALTAAQASVDATYIRAPEDGWVLRTLVGPGASLRVGQPIVEVWIGNRAWVDAWIDEAAVGQLGIGSRADIMLAAYPDTVLKGSVEAIAVPPTDNQQRVELASAASRILPRGQVNLRITLGKVDLPLMPGLSAVVAIPKRTLNSGSPLAVSRWRELRGVPAAPPRAEAKGINSIVPQAPSAPREMTRRKTSDK
jgi:multidrug resistance efflux pump